SARVSPRWSAAAVQEAQVTVRYPAGQGYVSYRYRLDGSGIDLHCTSCAEKATLRVPLPAGKHISRALLNNRVVNLILETVEETTYAVGEAEGRGAQHLRIDLD